MAEAFQIAAAGETVFADLPNDKREACRQPEQDGSTKHDDSATLVRSFIAKEAEKEELDESAIGSPLMNTVELNECCNASERLGSDGLSEESLIACAVGARKSKQCHRVRFDDVPIVKQHVIDEECDFLYSVAQVDELYKSEPKPKQPDSKDDMLLAYGAAVRKARALSEEIGTIDRAKEKNVLCWLKDVVYMYQTPNSIPNPDEDDFWGGLYNRFRTTKSDGQNYVAQMARNSTKDSLRNQWANDFDQYHVLGDKRYFPSRYMNRDFDGITTKPKNENIDGTVAQGKDRDDHPDKTKRYVFEVFRGVCRIVKSFIAGGDEGIGIDWARNKFVPKGPCEMVDLTKEDGKNLLANKIKQIKAQGYRVYVHIAPPCGTASKAREIPIPEHLKEKGCPEPTPLRSDQLPEGLPNLKKRDAVRGESANIL